MTDPNFDAKLQALQMAARDGGVPSEVVARANEYHAFLTGGAAPAKAATANKTDTTTKATAASGTSTKAASGKPAQAKPAQQPAKAPGGKHTADDVRGVLRTLVQQNKDLAVKLVSEVGGGASKFSDVKPEYYDALYEALSAELENGDSGGSTDDITG